MAWVPQIDPVRIHDYLNALSAAGRPLRVYGPNFEPMDISADTRRMLYPVVAIEPDTKEHSVGLGMDVALFPQRKVAFEKARNEQRVIATAPAGLLASYDAPGYVFFSPVYDEHGFAGCLMFVFPVDQLLADFARGRAIPMNFRIYDVTDPDSMRFLAGVTRQGGIDDVVPPPRSGSDQEIQQYIHFAGRKTLAVFEPGPDLTQAGIRQALVVGVSGLILTGMILWGLAYFVRFSQRLAREVATTNSAKHGLELVNRELGHRVGNLLAVAQALIWLTYEASLSTAEFRDAVLARLHALHKSVGLINREDWKGVWVRELANAEFAPIADRIEVHGRDILLKSRAAQSLSLLFYELMTNSSKHGALSQREGTVTAEWELREVGSGRQFYFKWQEHGSGITEPPTRQGFGTRLLTRLVPSDLAGRATLNFEPSGFSYELLASVERVVEREESPAMAMQTAVAE